MVPSVFFCLSFPLHGSLFKTEDYRREVLLSRFRSNSWLMLQLMQIRFLTSLKETCNLLQDVDKTAISQFVNE